MVYRFIDISVSLLGLCLLAAPMAVIGLLIKLESPGPVFFRQERMGRDAKPFMIWKFRTMVDGAVNKGLGITTSQDDDRITRTGRILRALSLDEVPQLVNVLNGTMSLVGPRPTLRYQVEQYTEEQRHRLDVKPGMTSWAAVNGRNGLTWEQRINLDLWYVRHKSLWLDFKIILKTFWVAFVSRKGVYAPNGANDDFTSGIKQEQRTGVER
jgi:lipopolysaccharide/colanic/teichoic acid biosynthesis glycosyltransferase